MLLILSLKLNRMSKLFLPSLEISNYRGLRHLVIPKLGRVNLIVGKNNVGKTSLLEALWLYLLADRNRRMTPALAHILLSREEMSDFGKEDAASSAGPLRHLFYGRRIIPDSPISIGPAAQERGSFFINYSFENNTLEFSQQGVISVDRGKATFSSLADLVRGPVKANGLSVKNRNLHPEYIEANGLSWLEIADLWDKVNLTPGEESVVASLRIIEPSIVRIGFVGDTNNLIGHRIPMVLLNGQDQPIPLRSSGEGMNKLLGLDLALESAKDLLLLVDEIESGLHYSAQTKMWRLVFETARRLNVQVFATTHSWDCIEAFQKAAVEDEESEGMLIRLEAKGEDIKATLFDERRLSIATKEHIEVR